MALSEEHEMMLVHFIRDNKSLLSSDVDEGVKSEKWAEITEILRSSGAASVDSLTLETQWDNLKASCLNKLQTKDALTAKDELVLSALSVGQSEDMSMHVVSLQNQDNNSVKTDHLKKEAASDPEEPQGETRNPRKRGNIHLKSSGPRNVKEVSALAKKKIQLECRKLEMQMEQIPLECAKLELEIQQLQRDLDVNQF